MKKFTIAGWQMKCGAAIAAALLVQSCAPMATQQHDATFASDAKQQDEELASAKGGHEDAQSANEVLAQNDATAASADFSDSVDNHEMDKIRGGSDTLTLQNGIVSDNTLSGNFTTGDNIISNSFNNATVYGQVVMVSGDQNVVQASTAVNITIENMPAAAR